MTTAQKITVLVGVNFLYALEPLAAKYTSSQPFLSLTFCLGVVAIFAILGTYAIAWQQILKRIELSTAYMFKGTSLIFVLVLSALLLGDTISIQNVIGSALIIIGIILYAK